MQHSSSNRSDLELSRRIVSRDIEAWHAFIDRYSRLIFYVIGRYMAGESEDEIRTMFVAVLEQLYTEKLAAYDGSSALSTWVTLMTRRQCLDRLRSRFGRPRRPEWLTRLSSRQQEVYRLSCIEGLDYREICARIRLEEPSYGTMSLAADMRAVHEHIDARMRDRLAYDLRAKSLGRVSGRVLQYSDELRSVLREGLGAPSPEDLLQEKESAEQLNRLRRAVSALPEFDREILRRFYDSGWTAKQIAHHYGLADQRRSYTVLSRAIRQLRRALLREHSSAHERRDARSEISLPSGGSN